MSFWNGVTTCLKVFAPLVKVLRLVDGDRKPAMGFVYEELLQAKEKNQSGTEQSIRILSLTTSSSECERNWSTFEGVSALATSLL
ncbi:hypothetical protein ACOSQ3_027577 [Xanthoceras sorbifolium]